MIEIVKSDNRVVVTAVTRLLLEGAELISFKYDSGFTVFFQRTIQAAEQSQLPAEVGLVLRASWSVNPRPADLKEHLGADSISKLHCRPEQPYQAFRLMAMVGHTIVHVDVGSDGALEFVLSNDTTVVVSGKGNEWEFSWYLYVATDVPGVDSWSINCDSEGHLEGAWPNTAPIPIDADEQASLSDGE